MSKKTETPTREKYAVYLEKTDVEKLRAYQVAIGVPVSESIRRAVAVYCQSLVVPKVKKP